mmetsp:Transcript_115826/g.338739  ORF Transcript_115826/g.338739 Transcript_115826/m.338739 type:complete len:280 (-) Transcript_115826:539-1378(-)
MPRPSSSQAGPLRTRGSGSSVWPAAPMSVVDTSLSKGSNHRGRVAYFLIASSTGVESQGPRKRRCATFEVKGITRSCRRGSAPSPRGRASAGHSSAVSKAVARGASKEGMAASRSKAKGRCPKLKDTSHWASMPTQGHKGTFGGVSSTRNGEPRSSPLSVKKMRRSECARPATQLPLRRCRRASARPGAAEPGSPACPPGSCLGGTRWTTPQPTTSPSRKRGRRLAPASSAALGEPPWAGPSSAGESEACEKSLPREEPWQRRPSQLRSAQDSTSQPAC